MPSQDLLQNSPPKNIPHIGFAGFSGSGKTTLVMKLLQIFSARQWCVATLKHAHHSFTIDIAGKDSFEHRASGAQQVIVSSKNLYAHMVVHDHEPELQELLHRFFSADFILVEGFKREEFSKIEVYRLDLNQPLLAKTDHNIIAIASPQAKILAQDLADLQSARNDLILLDLDQPADIADFILNYFKLPLRNGMLEKLNGPAL